VEAITPAPTRYPGVGQAALLLLLAFGVSLIAQLGLLALKAAGIDPRHPGAQAAATLFVFAIVVAYGVRRTGSPADTVLPLRPVPLSLLAPMMIATLGIGILLSETDNLLRSVLPPPAWVERMLADLAGGRRSLWGSVALLVVAAPLTEEALFRGVFLHGFFQRFTAARAVFVAALLFAVFHLNPWQFVGALTAGVLFGWWRAATSSLVPGLVCHALNNAMPIVIARSGARIPGYAGVPSGTVEFHPWWLDVIGLAVAAGGLWLVARALRHAPSPSLTTPDRP